MMRLRENESPDVRRETVAVLIVEFNQPDLQPGGPRLAEAIFRIMVRDADVGMRRAHVALFPRLHGRSNDRDRPRPTGGRATGDGAVAAGVPSPQFLSWAGTKNIVVFFLAIFLTVAAAAVTIVARADQTDPRLDGLFVELHETDNPYQARQIERLIWGVWLASKSPTLELLMGRVVTAMGQRKFGEALELLHAIVTIAPEYAEGWNKRATVYFLLRRYEESIADAERTLDLEPRHFGALSGLGLIYGRLQQGESALDAYERALKVNPHLEQAEKEVKRLLGKVKGRKI